MKIVKSQLIERSHIFFDIRYNIDNASEIPQLLVCSTLLIRTARVRIKTLILFGFIPEKSVHPMVYAFSLEPYAIDGRIPSKSLIEYATVSAIFTRHHESRHRQDYIPWCRVCADDIRCSAVPATDGSFAGCGAPDVCRPRRCTPPWRTQRP